MNVDDILQKLTPGEQALAPIVTIASEYDRGMLARSPSDLLQSDMLSRTIDDDRGRTYAPVLRVCGRCTGPPPGDIISAMLDHRDRADLELKVIG